MNKEYILVTFTENHIGVLNRITACYLRRKINIESLKVSESSIKGISMFVISAYTTEESMEKIAKQMRNIVEVMEVRYYDSGELITQEIALYKVSSNLLNDQDRVGNIMRSYGSRLIEFNPTYIVMEKTGTREDIETTRVQLEQTGHLLECSRSGSIVLHRESLDTLLSNIVSKEN